MVNPNRVLSLVALLLLLSSNILFAQDSIHNSRSNFWNKLSVGVNYNYGSFLVTKAKAEYIRDSYASFGEIYFQQETNGKQAWQVSHRFPQWGAGFMYGNSGSKQYIGNMHALFAYMNTPLIKSGKYTASVRISFGPGWVSKPFDINTNSKNTLIGTKLNAYIGLALQNELRINDHLFLHAGINFIHLSNGGTTLPNLGLNTPALSAGVRVATGKAIRVPISVDDTAGKRFKLSVYTSVSLKQAPWVGGNYYLINNLQTELAKRVTRNFSYGGGAMLMINRSLAALPIDTPDNVPVNDNPIQIGIYGLYEHFFGKLSIPLQLGFYAYNSGKEQVLFQQFGLRYNFFKKWTAEFLLKSHMGQAEYIHTGFGYTF